MLNRSLAEPGPNLSDELGQCSARFQALGVLARCSEQAVTRERVSCEHDHEHVCESCDRHRYRELVDIGCITCLRTRGEARPLRLVEILL